VAVMAKAPEKKRVRFSVIPTGAVLDRQNTSEQPPPNMAAIITTNGEGCALNGTAVTIVFIDQ